MCQSLDVLRRQCKLFHCPVCPIVYKYFWWCQDLLAAIGHTRHGNQIAELHRKRAASYVSRFAGYVIGSDNSGIGFIKSMTVVERHAELTYAESLYEKVNFLSYESRPGQNCTHRHCWASSTQAIGSPSLKRRKHYSSNHTR
jgi:hypothetical protein